MCRRPRVAPRAFLCPGRGRVGLTFIVLVKKCSCSVFLDSGGVGATLCGENASSEDGNPQKHAFGGQGQTVTVATALGLGGWGAWGQRNLRLPIEKQRQSVTVTEAIRQGHMATDGGAPRCPHWHGDRHRKPRSGHLERRRGRLPGGAAGP